mmetsp:Transcript_181/g.275  ORF Transcript_181/g.275 Transcript_181/m.275 type:complete len:89 (+) Transcript_181:527-793(+)
MAFDLKFLSLCTSAAQLSPVVVLSFRQEMPIRVYYPMEHLGSLQYFLVPRAYSEDLESNDSQSSAFEKKNQLNAFNILMTSARHRWGV